MSARSRRNTAVMQLRSLSLMHGENYAGAYDDESHSDRHKRDDERHIDFTSVGLYLAGLQTCVVTVCCAVTSILSCWMVSPNSTSAVRTLAISTVTGVVLMYKPLRVGRVRGVAMLFNALRPCVVIYVMALVVEQLIHACTIRATAVQKPIMSAAEAAHTLAIPPVAATAAVPEYEHPYGYGVDKHIASPPQATRPLLWQSKIHDAASASTTEVVFYYGICLLLVSSGILRARAPRSEWDASFLITLCSLFALAMLPPTPSVLQGPLCESTSAFVAAQRILRATAFSSVYVALVYAAAPSQHASNELFICVARATAASLWIVIVPFWALLFAPIQFAIVMIVSLGPYGQSHYRPSTPKYANDEGKPLTFANEAPYAHNGYCAAPSTDAGSDIETASVAETETDGDSLRLAIANARAAKGIHHAVTNGGFSFQFSSNESTGFRQHTSSPTVLLDNTPPPAPPPSMFEHGTDARNSVIGYGSNGVVLRELNVARTFTREST